MDTAIRAVLAQGWGLTLERAEKMGAGAGSDAWAVTTSKGKFLLKRPEINAMNNPEAEPALCAFLADRGVPVPRFLPLADGGTVLQAQGAVWHLQQFVEGDIFAFHKGPGWLLSAMGDTLGTVHRALMHHAPLPTGIGAGYFAAMTPERAAAGYEKTLHTARALAENGGEALAADVANIEYRLALARRLGPVPFQVEDLTVVNTHGDYGLNQILCGDGCINAVIDWTSACRHPAVWEVLRSFLYADPASATGAVNLKGLVDYTAAYTARFPLTRNDLLNMGPVFFRQTAVSDYYGQYYASTAANKELFLHQARFTTAVLKWLEQNMDEMAARLAPLGK